MIPISKVVNTVLSLNSLNKLSNFATAKAGRDVRVFLNQGGDCYSQDDYLFGYCIYLGAGFYSSAFNDFDDIDYPELKDKYKFIASILYGAYYHELFHVLYTPFKMLKSLTYGLEEHLQSFAHEVSNILEDITIEGTGKDRYPYCTKYLDALCTCFQQESSFKLIKEAIETEPTNPGTMLAYLLHYCRGTDMSQFPTYQLWEDYKEFIEWGAYKCINTIDASLRCKRQLAYAIQLAKILDMKEPDRSEVENPGPVNPGPINIGSSQGKGSKAIQTINSLSDVTENGSSSSTPQDTEPDIKPASVKASSPSECSSIDDPASTDLSKSNTHMLANDVPVFNYGHYADKLSKYIKLSDKSQSYDKTVSKFESQIRKVVALIRKMQAQNNTSWSHYKTSGKVDLSTIYKKGNYKIFKKKNAPSEEADLVFEILVDNSGSMKHSKAKLAGEALIIFCEALSRLRIPFSVDAFTECYQAITISLKDYNESYNSVKNNMTLFTDQFEVSKLATWCGNVDEVNLQYVSEKLLERKEKDKVLIVISDGATCGDAKTLSKVASNIEKQNVSVLGIGIFDNNVESIYNNHIILRTQEDLEGLASFLNNYLIRKVFK